MSNSRVDLQSLDTAIRRFPFLLKSVSAMIPAALDMRYKYEKHWLKHGFKYSDSDIWGWMVLDVGKLLFVDKPALYRSICDEYKRVVLK